MARKRFQNDEDDLRARRDDGLDGDFIEEEWQFVNSDEDDDDEDLSDFGVIKPTFYIDEDDDVDYVDEEEDDDGDWDDEDDDDYDDEDEEDFEDWVEDDAEDYDDEEDEE